MGASNAVTVHCFFRFFIVSLLSAVTFPSPRKKLYLCFLSIPDWKTKPEIQGASEEEKSEGTLRGKLERKDPVSPKLKVHALEGSLGTKKKSPVVEAFKKSLFQGKLVAWGHSSQENCHEREGPGMQRLWEDLFRPFLPYPPSEDSHWRETL